MIYNTKYLIQEICDYNKAKNKQNPQQRNQESLAVLIIQH